MMKTKLVVLVVVPLGVFAACSSSPTESDVQTAIAGTNSVETTAEARVLLTLTAGAPTETATSSPTFTPLPPTSTPTETKTPSPTATDTPRLTYDETSGQISEWLNGAVFAYVYDVNNDEAYQATWASQGIFAYITRDSENVVTGLLISLVDSPLFDASTQIDFVQKLVTKYVSAEAFQWLVSNWPDEIDESALEIFDSMYGTAGLNIKREAERYILVIGYTD